MNTSLILIALAPFVLFWALGAYNRLIGLRASALQQLRLLLQTWQAQAQAICARLESQTTGDTGSAAWLDEQDETQRWRRLALSAQQLIRCCQSLDGAAPHLPSADEAASLQSARHIFEANWQRLFSAQTDLAGSAVPQDLQTMWTQQELLVQERLAQYQAALDSYHAAIGQFPAVILARLFHFEQTAPINR